MIFEKSGGECVVVDETKEILPVIFIVCFSIFPKIKSLFTLCVMYFEIRKIDN